MSHLRIIPIIFLSLLFTVDLRSQQTARVVNSETVGFIGIVDATEGNDKDYHIKFWSGSKLYSGRISHALLPIMIKRKVGNIEAARALLDNQKLKVCLANTVYEPVGMETVENGVRRVFPIVYGDIVHLEFVSSTNNTINNACRSWEQTAGARVPKSITTNGYIDVIEIIGSSCRIRIIAGEKIYSGIVSLNRLSALTRRQIKSLNDALTILDGRQISVTIDDLTSSNDVSNFSFGNISQLSFPHDERGGQTEQRLERRETDNEIIIDLSTDILFDFDKSIIRPDAVPALIRLARLLRQTKSSNIQLNGHTDSIASDKYNQSLSERRAASVKQWLVSKGGIDAGWLQTKGFGERQPVALNTNPDGSDNPKGRQRNRRVEVIIPRV